MENAFVCQLDDSSISADVTTAIPFASVGPPQTGMSPFLLTLHVRLTRSTLWNLPFARQVTSIRVGSLMLHPISFRLCMAHSRRPHGPPPHCPLSGVGLPMTGNRW